MAIQIGAVRQMGPFLPDPLAVPWPVADYLAEQSGITDPSQCEAVRGTSTDAVRPRVRDHDAYGRHVFEDRETWKGRVLTEGFLTFFAVNTAFNARGKPH